MQVPKSLLLCVLSAGLMEGVVAAGQGKGQGNAAAAANAANAANTNTGATGTSAGGNANALALSSNAVQTATASVGKVNATAGESPSATSNNNFINFCAGKTLTNGLQLQDGSCNGIPMGDIPSTANMVSTIITNPPNGATIPANQDFTFEAQTANLDAGTFTNAATTYYSAVQQLNGAGQIIGHMHFSAQQINGLNPSTPPAANTFAFFKGVDNAGNGNGLLSAAVAGGLPAGTYRVCTLSSAANHQPVIMPVAQRGAQDDCSKFTVANTGSANAAGNANANTGAAAAAAKGGNGAAAKGGNGAAAAQAANGKGAGAGGKGRQRGRFAKREFVA